MYCNGQIYVGYFAKFCCLLRIYELYIQIVKLLINFDIYIVLWKLNHLLSTDVSASEVSLATEPLNLEPQNTDSPNIEPLNTEPPNPEDPEYELDEEFPNTEPPTTEPSTEEPLTTNTLDIEPSITDEGRKNIFILFVILFI